MLSDRRPVYVLYLIGFLDLLAVSMVAPAFPVLLKSFGASPSLTGMIASIYGAVQLFSSPLVGKWSDKNGRYKVLKACLMITSIGYLASGCFAKSILAIALLRIIPGIFKHTQDLCRCGLIEECGETEKNEILGMFNAISSVGFIIGPSINGHIIEYFGSEKGVFISYTICASIFLVNVLIASTLKSKFLGTSKFQNGKNESGDTRETKALSDLSRYQKGIFASRFLLALAVMMFRTSFVLWLTHYHPGVPSTTVGYLLSYNGFLGLFCGFSVGPISKLVTYHKKEEKLQLHAIFLLLFCFSILLVSTQIYVVVVAMAILTLGTSILRVCGIILTVKYVDKSEIGKIQGLGSSVISVARFAAPLLGGILQEASYSFPIVACLLLSVSGLSIFYYFSYSSVAKPKNL